MSRSSLKHAAGITAVILFAASCDRGDDYCLLPPTAPRALPLAVAVALTSGSGGGPVADAVLQFSGSSNSAIPCSKGAETQCTIMGNAGKYEFDVTAPGFQTAHRTVIVPAAQGCGAGVISQHIAVALVPAQD